MAQGRGSSPDVAGAAVPDFALYGEAGSPGADMLHLESIASRSQRYRWEIAAHRHRGLHQVLWLHAGRVRATLDGQAHACEGPAVLVIPPGVVHSFVFDPHSLGCVLTLGVRSLVEGDARDAGPALRRLFAAPRVLTLHEPADAAGAGRLAALFDLLADESTPPRSSPAALWLARVVVWRLADLAQRREQAAPARRGPQALFTRFVELVEAHHAEHWPVARYADRLGLAAERLNRLVRAEAGCTALAFVHERLAREACRRLVYVAAPISQLGFELGFEDPAYFCRFFRRHRGCTPRQYRQRSAGG